MTSGGVRIIPPPGRTAEEALQEIERHGRLLRPAPGERCTYEPVRCSAEQCAAIDRVTEAVYASMMGRPRHPGGG